MTVCQCRRVLLAAVYRVHWYIKFLQLPQLMSWYLGPVDCHKILWCCDDCRDIRHARIIILPGQFIKHCKWQFGSHHIKGAWAFQRWWAESAVDSTRVTTATLHLHVQAATNYTQSLSRHYYPQLIAGTNLPTPKGSIAWWARADCPHITSGQGYYTSESKDSGRKWTQIVGPKTDSIPVNQPCHTKRPEILIAERAGWLHEWPVA